MIYGIARRRKVPSVDDGCGPSEIPFGTRRASFIVVIRVACRSRFVPGGKPAENVSTGSFYIR